MLGLRSHLVQIAKVSMAMLVFGLTSSFGVAPLHTNPTADHSAGESTKLSTIPMWNPLAVTLNTEDCDGDGVTCEQERKDGTDPDDPCDFILENQDCEPSEAWKKDDCDGDGVSNGKEKLDGTNPLDPCDFVLEHQDCSISEAWKKDDCDGDGVSNGKEKQDGTDPLDPCDFVLEHQDCSISESWKKDDCDGDGVSNDQDSEPYNDAYFDGHQRDKKKSEGEGNIIAEKDSPMMLMEKMQVLRYDLLRQYQLHYRLNR